MIKGQDFLFGVIFLGTVLLKNSKVATVLGLSCLALSIPLFSFWIFFTAERLIWYAAAFITLAILFNFKKICVNSGHK